MQLILVNPGETEGARAGAGPTLSPHGFAALQRLAATWHGAAPRFLLTTESRSARQGGQIFAARFAIEPLQDARLSASGFVEHSAIWLDTLYQTTGDDDCVLALADGELIRALLCRALGLPVADGDRLAMTPAHASALRWSDAGAQVLYCNAPSFGSGR